MTAPPKPAEVVVRIIYRVLRGREDEFVDAAETVLARAVRRRILRRTGGSWRPERDAGAGTITEQFAFPTERAWERADALLCSDRYVAAAHVLMDELVEPLGCDFNVTRPAALGGHPNCPPWRHGTEGRAGTSLCRNSARVATA